MRIDRQYTYWIQISESSLISMDRSGYPDRDYVKSQILRVFEDRVKGRMPDLARMNQSHDGREGDWLTKEMGLTVNGLNAPDFQGFEMKKDSKGKTSFGDWGPDEAIYKGPKKLLDRDTFLEMFGAPNPKKANRYSWSGRVFPNLIDFNYAGQKMVIEDDGIKIFYDSKFDTRHSRAASMYESLISLALWKHDSLKQKVESKFNQLGWFRCLKNSEGRYDKIVFGQPINYEKFLQLFAKGSIFLDCGMHQGNSRPYMTWRAKNNVWDELAEKDLSA